jgi:hypothetical protein
MPTKFEYEFYIFTDKGTATDSIVGYSGAIAQSMMESRYPGIKVALKNMKKVEENKK